MKLSDLRNHNDIVSEQRATSVEYAAGEQRLALADAVSLAVVHYRGQHGITQAALAAQLGWKQPQVARLEQGDVTPSWETLQRLARAGVLEVHLDRRGTEVRELAVVS